MDTRRKRTLYSLGIAAALVAALGILVFLRWHAPPEVARLLPESDAIVYFNLKPVRAATHFDQQPLNTSPEYTRFVQETGFRWDRDLDRIAVALHRMPDPNGPNGPVAYTGVLEGRFESAKVTQFLRSNSAAQESYAGHEVFTMPGGEGRVLRVSPLGYDMLAASNMPVAEQIHSVIDRYVAGASPFSGSSLLGLRYREIPYFAIAWGIGHVGLPFSERGHIQLFGIDLPLPEDTEFIASLTFRGTLHLRVEELAPTVTDAAQTATNLTTVVNLIRGFIPGTGTPQDIAFHRMLDSLQVQQRQSRVVLTGNLLPELLQTASR